MVTKMRLSSNVVNDLKNTRGQALIAGMGLMAVSAVIIFLIFNSGRAVNEKINLVNAADAAAYSGAQIAARQLNFIAYTNRTMIANEVAIGHMVSYQAEIDVFADALSNIGGIVGNAFETLVNSALAYVGTDIEDIMDAGSDAAAAYTSSYILAVSANNAAYGAMQQEEYESLASINGKTSSIDLAMSQVAAEYQARNTISISVNDPLAISNLRASGRQLLADSAEANNTVLCSLVMFVKPTEAGNGNGNGSGNGLRGHCNGLTNGNGNPGNGNGNGPKGTFNNPANDAGTLFEMLEKSTAAVTSADWISDRNIGEYKLFDAPSGGILMSLLGLIGVDLDLYTKRGGETEIQWDNATSNYNWVAANDTMDIYNKPRLLGIPLPASIKFEGTASTDAITVANRANGALFKRTLMNSMGLCTDVDCDNLPTSYQPIEKYAHLNPNWINAEGEVEAFLTAIVQQTGNCNDDWGIKEDGSAVQGWHDDQGRFGTQCDPTTTITAVSRAKVFYERPGCAGAASGCTGIDTTLANEAPNLFNPFWQAKLDYANTRPD